MSYLREIMQKLGTDSGAVPEGALSNGTVQAAEYRRRLEACSEPMLHYEWAWLEQHRQDLELCATNEAMLQVAGGQRHLDGLLAEAEQCLQHLREVMAARGLTPRRHSHSLAAAEHAWELSHPGIRAQWGIDAPPTA